MHSALLAPVLSAMRRIDSCWIISVFLSALLLGALDQLDHAPALGLGERPGLHDPDHVADPVLVLLVVRVVLLGPRLLLAVEGVRDAALDHHRDGLVGLVALHDADARLAAIPPALALAAV